MHRFYVPPINIGGSHASLSAEEARHLRDVLRLLPGSQVRIFDGEGSEFLCKITSIDKKGAELAIIDAVEPLAQESSLNLTLAPALTKGDKYDLVIQKAVELGVTRFLPLIAARCDVKLKDTGRRMERWQKIIIEASKQCGRAALVTLEEPIPLPDLLANETRNRIIFFSEAGGKAMPSEGNFDFLTAVVGPEGGWEPDELELASNAGADIVTLGGRILRAETAAIVLTALLQHRFGDFR